MIAGHPSVEKIARCMALYRKFPHIQRTETRHRCKLTRFWKPPHGARILEIGCGQGDATAALAAAVGDAGHVTAVDNAPLDYGKPMTVGESSKSIRESWMGSRVSFHYAFDVLRDARFESDAFDMAVFSHSAFYLKSEKTFIDLLTKIRSWCPCLAFAEWDLRPRSLRQIGHLVTALIQTQIQAACGNLAVNIRTLFFPEIVRRLLKKTGWRIQREKIVNSSALHDGIWEIEKCLRITPDQVDALDLPVKMRANLIAQQLLLDALSRQRPIASLDTYACVAERVALPPQPTEKPHA